MPDTPVISIDQAPVAEPGQTTTEFIGKTTIQLITLSLALLTSFGHGLSVEQQTIIMGIAGTLITILEYGYAKSRGIRKSGTSG